MKYSKTVILKDGRECLLRNGEYGDGAAALSVFIRTHEQTDYLLTYPDENTFTAQDEADFLKQKTESDNEIEIVAVVNGKIVGMGGIECVGNHFKTKHRAQFGVSIDKEYWGLGIGRAITKACIDCARAAGYKQLELDVVAENKNAISLYNSEGFTEYGRNPKGFRKKPGGWQELILMRLDLER